MSDQRASDRAPAGVCRQTVGKGRARYKVLPPDVDALAAGIVWLAHFAERDEEPEAQAVHAFVCKIISAPARRELSKRDLAKIQIRARDHHMLSAAMVFFDRDIVGRISTIKARAVMFQGLVDAFNAQPQREQEHEAETWLLRAWKINGGKSLPAGLSFLQKLLSMRPEWMAIHDRPQSDGSQAPADQIVPPCK